MDLDQLIYDADPARGLEIDIPAPAHAGARREPRNWGGRIAVACAVAAAVAVAVVGLSIGRHHPPGNPPVPARLPFSSPAPLQAPAGALARTARVVQTFPDPESGPAWGIRTYRTGNGLTCVQAGRTESGLIGAIGIDGAFSSDMRFHPLALGQTAGAGDCEPDDARGHAFINVQAVNTDASAGDQPCLRHDDALPREHCPAAALRNLYFGLLGPDAASVTYVDPDGRQVVQATRGHDGAYLVVRPVAHGPCNRDLARRGSAPSSCDYDAQGINTGATLGSGAITAVTYRDGHVCHLPAPQDGIVRLAQCPVVGYVPRLGPKYIAAQIPSPVTVRKLPARYYCQRPGVARPAALAIPCGKTVPPGYARVAFTFSRRGPGYDPGQNLLIYVSWTAHGPVENPDQSSYYIAIHYPSGCGAGGGGLGTRSRIRAGQRVTRYFYIPTTCRGTYTGRVTYVPDLGPDGVHGALSLSPAGALLVGAFTFTVP